MISSASLNESFGAPRSRQDTQLFAANDMWPYEAPARAASPARKLKTLVADLTIIGAGWALLVGIVVYPQAQIVGIAACAIALMLARK